VFLNGTRRVLGPKCPSLAIANLEAQHSLLKRELVLPR
jgi:hypothetical protein